MYQVGPCALFLFHILNARSRTFHLISLHLFTGSSPRSSRAVKWILTGLFLIAVYITPLQDQRTVTSYPYSIPSEAGQIEGSKLNKLPASAQGFMETFVRVKALTAPLLVALNHRIEALGWFGLFSEQHSSRNDPVKSLGEMQVAREAVVVQTVTNTLARAYAGGSNSKFIGYLRATATYTVMSSAARNHLDFPKNNPMFLKGVHSFIENKALASVPWLSTYDKDDPPLGRGSEERGIFVYALLDHSFRETTGEHWGEFRNRFNLQLNMNQFLQVIQAPAAHRGPLLQQAMQPAGDFQPAASA